MTLRVASAADAPFVAGLIPRFVEHGVINVVVENAAARRFSEKRLS